MSDTQAVDKTASMLANDAEWVIRTYREGDLPAFVALINSIDAAYRLGLGTSEENTLRAFGEPRADPFRQIVLAEMRDGVGSNGAPNKALLGAGCVSYEDDVENDERIYYLEAWLHPRAEDPRLGEDLAHRAMDIVRGYEADPSFKQVGKVTVKAYVREELHAYCTLWQRLGLREVRRYWDMERPLHDPIDEPGPIEGVTIRPFRQTVDNEAALVAFNDSFSDHYDHHNVSAEDWNYWMASPDVRTDLSWLAEDEQEPGRIVGFCVCEIHRTRLERDGVREGWIELLGTTRDHRRKGLGRALLLHGLHSLREEGLDTALLGVDSESLTGANRLYESVGFRIRRRGMQYEAPLALVKA